MYSGKFYWNENIYSALPDRLFCCSYFDKIRLFFLIHNHHTQDTRPQIHVLNKKKTFGDEQLLFWLGFVKFTTMTEPIDRIILIEKNCWIP